MKKLFLALVAVLAMSAGCNGGTSDVKVGSGNSYTSTKTINVTTCPQARVVTGGSCNIEVLP